MDFPHPLGPTMLTNSLPDARSETPFNAVTLPARLWYSKPTSRHTISTGRKAGASQVADVGSGGASDDTAYQR